MSTVNKSRTENEVIFHQLHHNGKILILPNIWDTMGALLLQDLGYPAIATASSSLALSRGYHDGEEIPFEELIRFLKNIVQSVRVPVTADVERCYASDDYSLKENIKRLIDTGIAGINYEDSIHGKKGMERVEDQCRKIELIRKAALERGSELFVNARIDVYIKAPELSDEQKLEEALKRGKAYKQAGADGLYPIILKDANHIEKIIKEIGLPVNITMVPGIPDLQSLQKIGLARISLASGFYRAAVTTMKSLAEKLMTDWDTTGVTKNLIGTDYLDKLISDSHD